MVLTGTFQVAALLNVTQPNRIGTFKSLNDGKQTKWNQPAKKVAICRGSLAWLGRQTHNLVFEGSNPSLGTKQPQFAKETQIKPLIQHGKQLTATANALFYAILNEGVQA